MSENLIVTILAVLITNGITILVWLLNKPKQKKEIESIITDQYHKLTERLGEERDDLLDRIKRNQEHLAELEKHKEENKHVIRKLQRENEECAYQHGVTELEMLQLKKQNDFKVWKRDMVFIIDDDEDVQDDFRHKFAKISVLDYKGFRHVDDFLAAVKIEKPPIVVLDYRLSGVQTAEDVIDKLGYEPEIFIMSGEKSYEKRFDGKKIKFFHKDDHYVYKIAMEILKYLKNKNGYHIKK